MTDTFRQQMETELGYFGITLSQKQYEQFFLYYEMLVEKNKVMNLTAITDEKEVVSKHFNDSLSLFKVLTNERKSSESVEKILENESVIDVGTGAGFPGIPLKIVFPGMRLTLLDSLNKRVKFLQEVCSSLQLEQVRCIHGRAEDIGREREQRETYDWCVSRAVANLSSLCEYCMPFVKTGGYFVPYKSGDIDDELKSAGKAIGILGGELSSVHRFILPGTEAARSLVVIKKVRKAPAKYPRKAGIPTKEPL